MTACSGGSRCRASCSVSTSVRCLGWMIGYASGPVMAASDSAQVVLCGQGGHGSRREAAIDPVLMAANIVTRLQGIVALQVPPAETAVVTVGRLQAGTKDNIIPDTAELGIKIRT